MTKELVASIIIAMKRIYVDHASTTPLDEKVLAQMTPYFTNCYGNAHSLHADGRKGMSAVDDAREKVARILGAKDKEIYFTSGGTESDNWAILGSAYAQKAKGKTRVILSSIEHHACLSSAERLEKEGFSVTYLPVNDGGRVEPSVLESCMDESVGVVAVMAVNNETGVIQPVEACAEIAKKFGAYFFTDAVQAVPYMPVRVDEWGVDMLSFSSHKFYGPKGCGVLYIKNGIKIEKLLGGGEQERGLRGGTLNVPAIVGLASALEKTQAEHVQTTERLRALNQAYMQNIANLSGVKRNGEEKFALPALLNLRFEGVKNSAFLYNMDLAGVSLSAGSACASSSIKPSHVLTAMGLSERDANESVRISFGKHNTVEEAVRVAKLTVETVKRLRES